MKKNLFVILCEFDKKKINNNVFLKVLCNNYNVLIAKKDQYSF